MTPSERERRIEELGDWQFSDLVERVIELEDNLRQLVALHHKTLIGSQLHDPKHLSPDDCPTLSCGNARRALARHPSFSGEEGTGP